MNNGSFENICDLAKGSERKECEKKTKGSQIQNINA
jgi:hypothetical protein